MKETESNSVCTNTPPAFSWDGDKETEETKPSDLQRQETNATTPSIVVEKRLAQRRTTEKAAVLDEVDAPSALGETSNQQHITTCRNSTDGDDSTDLLAEKERFAGRTSTSTAALQANERANAMLDYVDRKASIMEQDNNNISEESHYEEMMTQERKSILSERTAAAAGRGGGNHPANTNSPSLTNQGEQVQDRTSNNSNEEDVMDSREKNDPRRKNIATTSASVLEEKEQIIERNSPESLRANRNANMMLDYIARGEEASGNNTVDHHTHKGPRAASINHVVGGSLDHHDNDLPMSNEQDTSIHSFPGSVRVAGIDIEREGSIRILSDMPDDPTDAAGDDRNSGLLVHAHVVNDDENNSGRMIDDNSKVLATATPDPWWRRHQWWLAVGAAIIVGAITVAIILTTVEFGTPNTESPSMAPTSYAEGIEDQTVQLIESVLPLEEVSRLSDVSSSQYSALRWVIAQRLENEDKTSYWDSMDIMRHYSLAVLFFGTGGLSSWMSSDGWLNSTSVCDWYGVQCSSLGDDGADDAAVTGLNLTSNGLNGTISSDIAILAAQLRLLDLSDNDLSGTIPEQVGRMTALTHLSLAENNLSGSFPPSFGSMTKLLNLDLSANSLGATLPTELGFLTSLGELHLDENELNGEIPSEVGQLTALENIGVSENRLSYGLPSELGRMPFLKSLDAHGNTLLGPLPTEIGLLGNLRRLDVSDNYFFDKIPSDLGRVTTLTSLDLSNNLFTGTLPPDFGVAMNQLSSLRVRGNFLEGIIDFRVLYQQSIVAEADVPDQLSHLVNIILPDDVLALDDLTELDLSSNLFTGSIPAVFYSLPRLESLNVSSNKLGGPMLQGLEIWQELSSNLTVLDISSNVRLGAMPETIGILSNLNVLKTTSNFLGSLPTEIALLRNLITLDVSISECAAIPTILWSMTTLESLSIISERDPIANCPPPPIDASIPGEVGALTHLRELRITNSEGTIPSEFGLLTNLRSLDLVSIGLTGSLPSELGRLSLLTSLSMDGDGRNGLNGTLPTEIGMLKNAQILSAKYNSLSGSIPTEVTMLTQAESLDMQNNNIVGPLPSEMLGMMTNLKVLNLASNAVSGTLPTQLGMMTKLKVLNLDSNAVSGTLPTQLGMMTKLKVLNLDSNAVSGTLPTQLGVLSNLNTFLLGYNALRGQLPSEIGLVQDLVELSLEHNAYLNSTIPSEIGLLTSLTDLSLQSNSLSGSLPSELGLVTLLESLFMSNNFFTGSLPSELGRLANLFTLDLSNNTLSGMFISDSISDETCENSPSFTVDCEKVACRCCRCPTPSPSVQPSQSDAPTNTPTTSAPSSSPNPTEVPSLSFQPSLTFAPSSTARTCSMFSPIASTGSRLADVSDLDDGFEVVTLPFMFPWFNESMYNNVTVTSNGVLFPGVSLDNGCCSAQPIEMLGSYSIPRIAVAQMDLSPQNGNGAIYTSTHQLLSDGEDDDEAFIISWEDVQIYRVVADENNGGGLNFQVLLYANGNMEMRWGEGSTGGILLASGVEDDAANVTAPVTGLPYNRTDQPGVSDEWPQNQCRLFFKKTTLDGGLFGQVTSSGDNSG